MTSPNNQIARECRPLLIDEVEPAAEPPSLTTLRWGLAMLFAGMMLTLGVTLSLDAAGDGHRPSTADSPRAERAAGSGRSS
ncbi:hypothetical protein [Halomonas denitrificans]|nr:hypothetical protein [Halomonas denitrificans]